MSTAQRDSRGFYQIGTERYPSVTTILNIIAKPGLYGFYGKWGSRARLASAVYTEFGTAVHAACEHLIRKEMKKASTDPGLRMPPAVKKGKVDKAALAMRKLLGVNDLSVRTAVNNFRKWWKASGLTPISTEQTVHSQKYGYAGTLDLYAEKNDKQYVIDFKTGGIYEEYWLQLAAYRQACAEQGMSSNGAAVVQIPRDGGVVSATFAPVEHTSLDAFLAAFELWKWQRLAKGQEIE
jgi:hypothetical protein